MAKAVFLHKPTSAYRDVLEEQYEFPKSRYLSIAEKSVGDWIVYYRPGKGPEDRVYFATARVSKIQPAFQDASRRVAVFEPGSYLEFETNVPRICDGRFMETKLSGDDGEGNLGWAQWSVRDISDLDYYRIMARAFPEQSEDLPRQDLDLHDERAPERPMLELDDEAASFEWQEHREVKAITLNRKIRDRAFRHKVLQAYGKRCAFTGLQLINGGGRAEVEAAHIQPVEASGPDSVRNGLALSGTVHWMFDRGMLSLTDDFRILVSRHLNNRDHVERLLGGRERAVVPSEPERAPHPRYLNWHRINRFKN